MNIVSLTKESGKPKYKQIVTSIEEAILKGALQKGDQLPSLNVVKNEHKVSRDTVLTAFSELKNRGIIHSVVGKGYYVSTNNVAVSKKIFLLFDELNPFKEELYNSFLNNLNDNTQVDIFFHHFNINLFTKLIEDYAGNYNYYIIMPGNFENTNRILQRLPSDKVFILDQFHKDLLSYSGVYQNFEKDIYKGLESGLKSILKYNKLNLIATEQKQPKGIFKGFKKFCDTHNFDFEILKHTYNLKINSGELYFILEDKNLISFIKKIKQLNLDVGKEVGIISFNDSPLKEIVEDGITTISTDFKKMGKTLAKMILENHQIKIENKSELIIRKSI